MLIGADECVRSRNMLFFTRSNLWPTWPFLPLIRRCPGQQVEFGLLYDARGVSSRTGYSATVFRCNLFCVPQDENSFLALPKEIHDTPEEVFESGWRVD
jgi:hypothetical protein